MAENIEEIQEKEQETEFFEKIVSCDGFGCLNVRENPSIKAEIVRTLEPGAHVMCKKPYRGWCEVEGGGYSKSEYLV